MKPTLWQTKYRGNLIHASHTEILTPPALRIWIGKIEIKRLLQVRHSLLLGQPIGYDIQLDALRNKNAVLCIDRIVKLSGHHFKIAVVFYTRSPRTDPSQSPSHPQVKIANKLRGRLLGCATCTKALARPIAWKRIVRLRRIQSVSWLHLKVDQFIEYSAMLDYP